MASPGATPDRPTERRSTERARVACPAQLHLTTGIRSGSLWDLSAGGARVAMEDPPRVGTAVLLKWQSHEAFGCVVWVRDGTCGVTFDRMLPRAMLDEGLLPQEEAARAAGPAAAVGSIQLGRSRFGRRNAQDVPAAPVAPAAPTAQEVPPEPVKPMPPAETVGQELPTQPVAREALPAPAVPKLPPEPVARETPPEPVAPDLPVEPVTWEEPDEAAAPDVPVAPTPPEAPVEPVAREAPVESVAEDVAAAPIAPRAPPETTARRAAADCPFPNWEPPPTPPVAAVDSIPLGRRRLRP
jgi:hypothetical protein